MTDIERGYGLDTGAQMTIWEHLAELRTRLIRIAIALGVGLLVGWILYPAVVDFLVAPYRELQPNAALYATDLLQGFAIRVQTSLFLAVVLAMPVILWQIWRFVTPGLYEHERRYAVPFVLAALVLFVLGACIAYYTLPAAIEFLISVAGADIRFIPTIESYLKLNMFMMLAFGVGMEFPVLLVALQLVGVLRPGQLAQWRRQAIVLIAVLAAVITPSGDPISLLALALPMYLCYELSIIIGWIFQRRRARAARDDA